MKKNQQKSLRESFSFILIFSEQNKEIWHNILTIVGIAPEKLTGKN